MKEICSIHIQSYLDDFRMLYINIVEQNIIFVVEHLKSINYTLIFQRGDVDNRIRKNKVSDQIFIELNLVIKGIICSINGGGECVLFLF